MKALPVLLIALLVGVYSTSPALGQRAREIKYEKQVIIINTLSGLAPDNSKIKLVDALTFCYKSYYSGCYQDIQTIYFAYLYGLRETNLKLATQELDKLNLAIDEHKAAIGIKF